MADEVESGARAGLWQQRCEPACLAALLVPQADHPGLDKFEGLGIFLDTYANGRHGYSFPRITAMMGDGLTEYDQAGDGEVNSIGACSVSPIRET
jgi:hypothetical protein